MGKKTRNISIVATTILAMAGWASAELLIGWDKGVGTNYSYNASGISGNLYTAKTAGAKTDGNSTDGTFGSAFTGADTSANWAVAMNTNAAVGAEKNLLGIRIANNTGSDLALDALHVDISRLSANSPQDFILQYGYGNLTGMTSGDLIGSVIGLSATGKISDYYDADFSLTGMTDYVLANGQSATFQLIAQNGLNANNAYVDNIAISGSVIPEPATLGLVTVIGAALFGIRRMMLL
ncbi:MAG: hypothetical protein K9L89_05715 [Kiritimatiellales bacterium]|nr:hypothetical protein [Kiritimatiellales bacterium]